MKKLFLLAAFIIVAANGCKMRKVLHTETNTSDSTKVKNKTIAVSTSKTDSSSEDIFSQFWRRNEKSDLSIGSVDVDEEYTPGSAGKIYFKADSVRPGDTLVAYGAGGSTLKVYTDPKTKQQVASMQQPGSYKKKMSIKNLQFTHDKGNDSGKIADHKQNNIKLNHDSLQAVLDSLNAHKQSAKMDEDKRSVTKGINLNWIIPVCVAIAFYFVMGFVKGWNPVNWFKK